MASIIYLLLQVAIQRTENEAGNQHTEENQMDEFSRRSRLIPILGWIVVPAVLTPIEWLWRTYVSILMVDGSLDNLLKTLLLFGVLTYVVHQLFKRGIPRYKRGGMLIVGVLWTAFFIVFDTLTLYHLYSADISTTLASYNLLVGGVRGLLIILMLLGPFFFVRTPLNDPDLLSMPIGKMATIGLLPSSLKIAYYRRRGAEIGEGVNIGPLSILDCKKIVIGDHVNIGMACMIRANEFTVGKYSKLGMLVIIDTHKVVLGEEVTIQEQVYIGGLETDKSVIEIGDLSMIFAQSVLNPTHPIKIGKRVGIGGSNFLFTHGTWQPILRGFPVAFGPITIEDGVWFPWRVFVLPNVHIGKEATIGAGSVINRDVPSRCLAAGVPAKVLRRGGEYIKDYTDAEKRDILRNMLVELVGYLRIEEWEVSDPVSKDEMTMAVFRTPYGPSSKADNRVVFLFEDTEAAWSEVDERSYVVTLFAVDKERAMGIEQSGAWWFDLESETWGGSRTNVSLTMNGWLARYGHWLKYEPYLERSAE